MPREMSSDASGLLSADVDALRQRYGYNELLESHQSLIVQYLQNFWGPLPWLMELTIAITLVSGSATEGIVIAVLLVINSFLSIYQRHSADAALALLRHNLQVFARAQRDGTWTSLPAREILPGDLIRLRAGDIIPADAEVRDGTISVDLSSLTGESLPREQDRGEAIFSGSIVKRGEATALVQAIGTSTKYGQTTELLELSHPPTHMERVIFTIIKYFFGLNVILAILITVFGLAVHAQIVEITNFIIVLLLTSIPVAFPTMFAVTQSYGALQLSRREKGGVLVRRLAAVQDGALMDVLCSDKTGTLTLNKLSVAEVTHYGAGDGHRTLAWAAACSNEANGDSIDMAILSSLASDNLTPPHRTDFTPFDPATKRTQASIVVGRETIKLQLGLPELLLTPQVQFSAPAKADVARLSAKGLRVVAVIARIGSRLECVGVVGLADPIRPDAPAMIKELKHQGIRVIMITGDGRTTARTVADQLGLTGPIITPAELKADPSRALTGEVFAEAYPEDKLMIIRALQQGGHTVGMTGDGVNDAPALHQAEVGIAVTGATDVAKQAASFILTSPGLEGVLQVVTVSRSVYGRLRTWALNKVVKSIEVSVVTTIIFLLTHTYILTPLLAVLLLFANDFVTIAIAVDRTGSIDRPVRWNVGRLIAAAALIALIPISLMFMVYLFARAQGYSIDVIRTITYAALVIYGTATLYAVRVWPHAWSAAPSRLLVEASIFSILFTVIITAAGIFIARIPITLLVLIGGAAIASFFLIDVLKQSRMIRRWLSV